MHVALNVICLMVRFNNPYEHYSLSEMGNHSIAITSPYMIALTEPIDAFISSNRLRRSQGRSMSSRPKWP
jgi:hypothetical protein